MSDKLFLHSSFEALKHTKTEINQLRKSMGLEPELFTEEEMRAVMKGLNTSLNEYFSQPLRDFALLEPYIFADPVLQGYLNINLKAIKSFSLLTEEEKSSLLQKWKEVISPFNEGDSLNYGPSQQAAQEKFTLYSQNTPFFNEALFYLHGLDNLVEKNFLYNNFSLLTLKGFNPLVSSVSSFSTTLISAKNEQRRQKSSPHLSLDKLKQIASLGFNFDWLIAFEAKAGGHQILNSLLTSLYVEQSTSAKTQDYLRFIWDNSLVLKNPMHAKVVMQRIHSAAMDASGNGFVKAVFDDSTRDAYLNYFVSFGEKDKLEKQIAASPALPPQDGSQNSFSNTSATSNTTPNSLINKI